jgi:hypothetical protein
MPHGPLGGVSGLFAPAQQPTLWGRWEKAFTAKIDADPETKFCVTFEKVPVPILHSRVSGTAARNGGFALSSLIWLNGRFTLNPSRRSLASTPLKIRLNVSPE